MFARCLVWSALVLPWATAGQAGVTTLDFRGSLPPGAQLTRPSAAIGAGGGVVPAEQPRFQAGAVTAGATFVRALPANQRILASTPVDGVQYSVVRVGKIPELTAGDPGAVPPPVYTLPAPSLRGNFDYAGQAAWGLPSAVEILPDGTVIVHTAGGGPEIRSMTLRTTLASFSDPNGWELVRVSDYSATNGPVTFPEAMYPRRSVFLAHLGVWASAVAEYASPGFGRDLGYASTDSGRTWKRVIDSDLGVPDRVLEPIPKHMHHLEPFEWFDETDLGLEDRGDRVHRRPDPHAPGGTDRRASARGDAPRPGQRLLRLGRPPEGDRREPADGHLPAELDRHPERRAHLPGRNGRHARPASTP